MKGLSVVSWLLFFMVWIPLVVDVGTVSASTSRCEQQVARIVSIQGKAEMKYTDAALWQSVGENEMFCSGDTVRVLSNSRAALLLNNNVVVRLDQHTIMTLKDETEEEPLLLKLFHGALYYFSILPQRLRLDTPFINGAVEGTEFLVNVTDTESRIAVFEGRLKAANGGKEQAVASGQMASSGKSQPLEITTLDEGRQDVQWALYYPPLLDLQSYAGRARKSGGENVLGEAVGAYLRGDISHGLLLLEQLDGNMVSLEYYQVRIALYLTVGRALEAKRDIDALLAIAPEDGAGLSFQALLLLTEGKVQLARTLAEKAMAGSPEQTTPLVVLSYIEQFQYQLEAAKQSIEKALELSAEDGLLYARYAELIQSLDNTSEKAIEAGNRSVQLTPSLARSRTVLGFIHLNQLDITSAVKMFEEAVVLDPSAPLPRLGLGLSLIYRGELEQGRDQISIAAVLDPGNAIVRSYLGKAYFEVKDYGRSRKQLDIATALDPNDPTPYYYSAIENMTRNRPGEALGDMQESIARNDNRAVFRSRLMLDKDLAARSSGIGRVFNQLGFEQLALNYGRKSLENAPSDYSSHRLLADSYSSLPGHEIARVSELLQSQLLQPMNIGPVQPQLAETGMSILDGAGPSTSSFYEYNQLFERNSTGMLVNGLSGGNGTYGNDLVVSGNYDNVSLSLGQFYYTSDGFRENNDLEQELYNLYGQWRVSPKTHIIAEARSNKTENGDLNILFDPGEYMSGYRQEKDVQTLRIGGRQGLSSASEVLAMFTGQQLDETVGREDGYGGRYGIDEDTRSLSGEMQHLYTSDSLRTVFGGSYYDGERESSIEIDGFYFLEPETVAFDHTALYGYGYYPLSPSITLTVGLGYDDFDNGLTQSIDKVSPKAGLSWSPYKTTTLRLAWIQGMTRNMISEQTIEPTQLAGFNQLYDDQPGTEVELFGAGFDQELSTSLFVGGSFMHRDLQVPYTDISYLTGETEFEETEWENQIGKVYLYWLPLESLSLALEYYYEKYDRGSEFFGTDNYMELTNHRGKMKIAWFHPSGARAELSTSYVEQEGDFVDYWTLTSNEQRDSFWLTDASVGYLLPKGYGLVSFDVKNLFDTEFKFQEEDPTQPNYSQEQLFLLRLTLKL